MFLRYIVDHYDSFPDIAIFVHGLVWSGLVCLSLPIASNLSPPAARPEDHQKRWLDMIPCIHPNATYININIGQDICRTTHNW